MPWLRETFRYENLPSFPAIWEIDIDERPAALRPVPRAAVLDARYAGQQRFFQPCFRLQRQIPLIVAFGTAPHFGRIHARLERYPAAEQAHVLAVAFDGVAVDDDHRGTGHTLTGHSRCHDGSQDYVNAFMSRQLSLLSGSSSPEGS